MGLLESGIEWVVGAPFPRVYDFRCAVRRGFAGRGFGPAFDFYFFLVLIFALFPHAGSKRSRYLAKKDSAPDCGLGGCCCYAAVFVGGGFTTRPEWNWVLKFDRGGPEKPTAKPGRW